jgi:hypothetical protein
MLSPFWGRQLAKIFKSALPKAVIVQGPFLAQNGNPGWIRERRLPFRCYGVDS